MKISHEEDLSELCEIYFNFTNDESVKLKLMKLGLRKPTNVLTWKVANCDFQNVPQLIEELDHTLAKYHQIFDLENVNRLKSKFADIFITKTFFDPQLEDTNTIEGIEVRKSFLEDMEKVKFKAGVYFLYNDNKELIYIGKSSDLGSRIPTSIRDRKATKYSYALTKTFSDAGIYEMYYISKLKPKLNVEGNFPDYPTVKLPDLKIQPIKNVFKE
mgnify:CR=1 FL=1